ncbi:MAG: hypothetical protein PHP06_05520 [Clostridia bacterium]|nr:hypothetical protein [Clostridia bacterium]
MITDNIKVKQTMHKNYGRCIYIANKKIELLVTIDLGPRIIHFGLIGGSNEFCENAPFKKQVLGKEWMLMGGHRLWHSPEHEIRSYLPEQDPVKWERIDNGIKVIQTVEPWAQIQKEIEINLYPNSNKVNLTHCLINMNAWDVELAAWALSVMAPGGTQIIPQPNRDTGLLANHVIALWPYSKMNDNRVFWGGNYIILKQDSNQTTAFKFGISNEKGWAAYLNHRNLFIKRFKHKKNACYPDFGVSYETYTTDFMMEMESLSPLKLLVPGGKLIHKEEWELIDNINIDVKKEKDADIIVNEYVEI